jgi:hypothetical protein
MLATPDAWICWEHDVESADPGFPGRHSGCPIGALHFVTSVPTRPLSGSGGPKSRPMAAFPTDHRAARGPLSGHRSLPLQSS